MERSRLELTVQATWREWAKEKPEFNQYFFILGSYMYEGQEHIIESLAHKPDMLYMDIQQISAKDENDKWKLINNGEPYPAYTRGMSRFDSDMQIIYWIPVEELHPNFMKISK